jgi:hypothetical protein
VAQPVWHTNTFRLAGLIPLFIFLYRLAQYVSVGTPDWIMYNCHLSTLLLAVAMFRGWLLGLRIAAIWLVIGLPMWLIDAWVIQELWVASIISHLGGFLLALYVSQRARATGQSWLPALGWFLFWQLVTRYTTAPQLNINIAHAPYAACARWFPAYWAFWPVCAASAGGLAWGVEWLLARGYPVRATNITPSTVAGHTTQAQLSPEI